MPPPARHGGPPAASSARTGHRATLRRKRLQWRPAGTALAFRLGCLVTCAALTAPACALAAAPAGPAARAASPGAAGPPAYEASPLIGRVFLVDPGHGGIDGGCHVGPIMEKAIVLAVGLELTRLLRQAGARVGITRNQDMELGHMLARGGSRYHRDLRARVALARRLGPDLYVSLHVNASRDPSMSGAVVFYGLGRPDTRRAAAILLEELRQVMPGNQNAALPADLFVLRENPYPAVLVELGFLTHPRDRRVLTAPDGQKSLAAALFRALVRVHAHEPAFPAPPPAEEPMGGPPPPVQAARFDPALCPGHDEP